MRRLAAAARAARAARAVRAARAAARGRSCAALAALALLALAGLAAATLLAAAARLRAPAPAPPQPARFVAGAFLEGVAPANRSFCRFNYGLPHAARLPPRPPASPELGAAGPFRVLYNVVQAPADPDPAAVTLCTHATADLVFALAEQARRWDGPVSVAVFAPRGDAALGVALLRRLCACLPQMARVSAHLVFPARHAPDLSARALAAAAAAVAEGAASRCGPPAQPLRAQTFRRRAALPYPVNAGRNAARAAARTRHVLVADVELLPSAGLARALRPLLAAAGDGRAVPVPEVVPASAAPPAEPTLARPQPPPPRVYVLPVFEVEADAGCVPSTKAELLELYAREAAFVFHRWLCPHCQRFPGLLRWLRLAPAPALIAPAPAPDAAFDALASPPPPPSAASAASPPATAAPAHDAVRPLLAARREPPYHRWEPIFVGTAADPLYSEALTWEGRQDKMTQAAEMCLRGYRFVVLDGAFLVHVPGMKRREAPAELKARAAHERANAQAYARIARRLAQRYPLRAARCRV